MCITQNEADSYRKVRLRVEDVQGRNVLTNFWVSPFVDSHKFQQKVSRAPVARRQLQFQILMLRAAMFLKASAPPDLF